MKKIKSFTIIELLIVISIIAVLVGIALPRLRSMQMEGDYAKAAGELRTLQTAMESFYIHNSRAYPVQTTTVDAAWQSDTDSFTTATPAIISSVLTDPFDPANEYRYATSAASNSEYYVILSVGPNRTAEITGINISGVVQGLTDPDTDDDIYVSNGASATSGF